jgi:adenosylhomocysteine nucleosidase
MSTPPSIPIKRLGIVAAMDEEFSRIAQRLESPEVVQVGPREFLCAQMSGIDVVCVRSRIGKVAAASTVTTLINRFDIDAVVFTGVAGGVASHVRVGDLVVGKDLMQHDIDLKGLLNCSRFDVPLLGVSKMPSSSQMLDKAVSSAQSVVVSDEYRSLIKRFSAHLPSLHVGTIASGDTFICSSEEREALVRAIPGLLCVEMEGGAVSQVCLEHGVPYVVCRVISDAADGDARVDFQEFLASAAAIGSDLFVEKIVGCLARGAAN